MILFPSKSLGAGRGKRFPPSWPRVSNFIPDLGRGGGDVVMGARDSRNDFDQEDGLEEAPSMASRGRSGPSPEEQGEPDEREEPLFGRHPIGETGGAADPDTPISKDRIPYAPEPVTPGDGPSTSEGRRRHERVTAPLDVIFQRKVFKAKDWSMTGFSLDPENFDLAVGQRFRFHARFHMRGAQMAAEFQAEVARRTRDRVGCRFVDVTPDQTQILRMLFATFRSGRAPTWEAMMALDDQGPVRAAPRRAPPTAGEGMERLEDPATGVLWSGWRPSPRMIYGVSAVVALAVIGVMALTRLSPDVESAFAAVILPGQGMTAASGGTVTEVLAAPGDLVGSNTVVLRMRPEGSAADAPSAAMTSPCACVVRSLDVAVGDRVEAGHRLATLALPGGQAEGPVIEALFPTPDLDALRTGMTLDVRLAGTASLVTGRVLGNEGPAGGVLPPVLEDRGGLSRVYLGLDGAPEGLYDGQPARVRLRRSPLAAFGL
jgi:hypothetical protein